MYTRCIQTLRNLLAAPTTFRIACRRVTKETENTPKENKNTPKETTNTPKWIQNTEKEHSKTAEEGGDGQRIERTVGVGREERVVMWIGKTVEAALCPEAATSVSRKLGVCVRVCV